MIKKQCIWAVLVGVSLWACISVKGYRIKGEVDGLQEGMAYLITGYDQSYDTLGRALVREGRFQFEGEVAEVTPVLLTLGENGIGGVVLFLENSSYKIKMNPGRMEYSEISGGGEAQRVANGYRLCGKENMKAVDDIREEFLGLKPQDGRFQALVAYVDSLQADQELQKKAYLEKHADSYLAMEELAGRAPRYTPDELKGAYEKFSPQYQQSFSGRHVASWIQRMEEVGMGQLIPDFTLEDPQGNSFTIHSVPGKVKLIEFWASWCGPCRKMIPQLKELYEKYHEQGLEILSISLDDKREQWQQALDAEKMSWPQGSDLKGNDPDAPLVKAYGIFGIPYTVLVDENNRILSNRFPELKTLERMISENIEYKK